MKALTVRFSIVCLAISLAPGSQAGLFDLLRGDDTETAQPTQRVALVGPAQVKEATGEVEVLDGIERWTPLQPGQQLAPGDIIRTGDGSAILKMAESGSLIRVHGKTTVRFSPLQQGWETGALTGAREKEGYVVRSLRGAAFVQAEDGKWKPLTVNNVLPEGAVLRTSSRAILDLFSTSDQRSIRVAGSSRVTLSPAITARVVRSQPALASAGR